MNLKLPVPAGTQITRTYQEHIDYRISKGWDEENYHAGIDYGGNEMPIYLCDVGEFCKTGYDKKGYGIYAKFKHDWGYSLYAHLKSTLPESSLGKMFAKGDVIGTSDNTGNSSGPHLHFEVRDTNNVVFDPTPYLHPGPGTEPEELPEKLTRISVISSDGLNFRSEPVVEDETFLGTAPTGAEFDVMEEVVVDGNRWVMVPVWMAAEYYGGIYVKPCD